KILLNVGTLGVQNGAQVSSESSFSSTGPGGDITIAASEAVTVSGRSPRIQGLGSSISASSFGSGDAGSVSISAPTIHLADGGNVSSISIGSGDAGSLTLTADKSFTSVNAGLTTEAQSADGGN